MDVFEIRGSSQEEVIALVTEELGSDAIILEIEQQQILLEYGEVMTQWVATAAKAREVMRLEQEIVQSTRRKAAQGMLFLNTDKLKLPAAGEQAPPQASAQASEQAPTSEQERPLLKLVANEPTEIAEERQVPEVSSQPAGNQPQSIKADAVKLVQQLTASPDKLNYAKTIEDEGRSQPVIEVVVGACGAGKSTTIAKLASKAHLSGHSVAVITLDSFRSCASELLQSFTDVMDVPCLAVSDRGELARTLLALKENHDLIYIDTPGAGPRDMDRLTHVQQLIESVHADRVHLALPADLSPEIKQGQFRRYQSLGLTHLIYTRLDEAVIDNNAELHLCDFAMQSGLPLSYLTYGQHVPEDIAVATEQAFREQLAYDANATHQSSSTLRSEAA